MAKTSTSLILLAAALLPLISEAFMHHPGMYGSYGNYNNQQT